MGGLLMDDQARPPVRRWQVLLLGGPSGVGKTAVSYRLARHFGVGVTEIDDFQALLERMTTPEHQPAIHFWRTHPAPDQLPAGEIIEKLLEHGRAMETGLEAVIANHLETATPVVLEGDFIHPVLATQASFSGQVNGGRVRAAFLHEPDEQQLVANYLSREPESGPADQTRACELAAWRVAQTGSGAVWVACRILTTLGDRPRARHRGGVLKHRPKPIHHWREFLREVGIIVLGVLIALGAEQSVEWLNWRAKAGEADVRLRKDAARVLDQMFERLEIQKCQDGRLTLIRDRLLASGPTWTAMAPFYTSGPPAGSTYAHPMRTWPRISWLNAVASAAAMQLPDAKLVAYSAIFGAAERRGQRSGD